MPTLPVREVLFVAGEASGDLHAARVADSLAAKAPDLRMTGVGGSRMQAAGVELIEDISRLAVMGFVEVLEHIPRHWLLLRRIKREILSGRPGLVVLLDYPGFNIKVAELAHKHGVPVLYYITPQVWAWGANRLPKLARVVTRAASILPFEEELLRKHGIAADFVGHPLLDRAQNMPSPAVARAHLGLKPEGPILALFPGSRRAEIDRHLGPFIDVAGEVRHRRPEVDVILSVAPTVQIDAGSCPFPLVSAPSFVVQRAATAGLLKSGTNTLEAAVAGLPHVIGYRTSAITYAIAKRLVTIPNIGLVNVVAGKTVSREFVQDALVSTDVADALMPLLNEASEQRNLAVAELDQVRMKLGSPGASVRVADIILEMLGHETNGHV